MSAFIPCSKTDPDYGRGISPYDDSPYVPVRCEWCGLDIEDEYDSVMYSGKPHHHICAIEDERNDREPF